MIERSQCCKAQLVEAYKNNPRDHHDPIAIYECEKCKQECEVEEVCGECLGEGTVASDVDDGEGHTMAGVGTIKCKCND